MEIQEHIISRYENLRSICRINWETADLEKIEKAFLFAHGIIGEKRFNHGEVILNHSLDVATIIAQEIGMGPDSIISGVLHNVMYAGLEKKATQKEIEPWVPIPLTFILKITENCYLRLPEMFG
jgi:GTP pyrophosphokinase